MVENNEDNKPKKPLLYYYAMIILVVMLLNALLFPSLMQKRVSEVGYSEFITMVNDNKVNEVVMDYENNQIVFSAKDADEKDVYFKTGVFPDDELIQRLEEHNVKFGSHIPTQNSPLLNIILTWIVPLGIFILLGQFISRTLSKKLGGGIGPAMTFGKANAKIYAEAET